MNDIEFFHSQESLSTIQWILRAVVSFFFLVIVAKLMGQRSISQLRFLDFVIAIFMGNIIAHPLSDEGLGLKGSMITILVVVFLYLLGVFLSLKLHIVRKLFDPKPIPLLEQGQIHYRNLQRARISVDFLLSELRKEKIEDITKVALAYWEPGGTISTFLYPQHEPVTAADLNLPIKPFDLHQAIIKDGLIDFHVLQQINKDQQWLLNKIKVTYNADVKDVLLATIDNNEVIRVFLYK